METQELRVSLGKPVVTPVGLFIYYVVYLTDIA